MLKKLIKKLSFVLLFSLGGLYAQEKLDSKYTKSIFFSDAFTYTDSLLKSILFSDSVDYKNFASREVLCLVLEKELTASRKDSISYYLNIYCQDSILQKIFSFEAKRVKRNNFRGGAIIRSSIKFEKPKVIKKASTIKPGFKFNEYEMSQAFVIMSNSPKVFKFELGSLFESNGKFFLIEPDFYITTE